MPWWMQALDSLNATQWEALCDGCGLCCLYKFEEETSGKVYFSRVACRLLDLNSGACSDYPHRRLEVSDCISLALMPQEQRSWLPPTCAYRLRAENKPLPEWHYLICGDRTEVHRRHCSVCHFAISEAREDAPQPEDYVLESLSAVLGCLPENLLGKTGEIK